MVDEKDHDLLLAFTRDAEAVQGRIQRLRRARAETLGVEDIPGHRLGAFSLGARKFTPAETTARLGDEYRETNGILSDMMRFYAIANATDARLPNAMRTLARNLLRQMDREITSIGVIPYDRGPIALAEDEGYTLPSVDSILARYAGEVQPDQRPAPYVKGKFTASGVPIITR